MQTRQRLIGWRDALLFGALTFLPLSIGGRGRLNSDTWQYLYTDPVGLMDRARSLWDPSAGGGNVTHQGIGYLWPMGPYYWFTSAIGVPDWLAQRWWVAGIQFAAALGVLALLRHLLPRHPAQLVAAALYGLSPFVLGHVTGPSALLLPYAALGWMVLCVVRAIEERGWRWPALFALIVTTCGSLNGSAVFFIIAGAVFWIPYAVWGSRTSTVRNGIAVLLRLGGLTLLTQLWWMVAYSVGGAHGLSLLAVTETVNTTSATTSAAEVLRGLGYWFFYARDSIGPWLPELAPPYTTIALIAISFAVPVIALLYGAVARWGPRVYFAGLIVVGTVLSVGAFPNPRSPVGTAFEAASRSSDLVLSLRNTQRAVPLVVLGLAGLVAAGGAALQRRHARVGAVGLAVLAVFIAAALPAQWRSGLIADRFSREEIPAAWEETAAYLDQEPIGQSDGRVLELPGIDFASYRWGHTFNPILGGLTDRPILEREIIPMGSPAGVSLLAALDRSLQEGTFEPASVAPIARLLGIRDIVVRNDLRYERYGTARPTRVWEWLTDPAAKLGPPLPFGGPYPNHAPSDHPLIDEVQLGIPVDAPVPPEVGVLKVAGGGRPIVSTIPAGGGLVVDGDGNGLVTAAAAGLLDGRDGPVLLAPELAVSGQFDAATGPATRYIVTDTDRKRAQRWYSLRENFGATEPADASITRVDDPSDARMDLAPGRAADSRTVAMYRGASSVWASSYGNDFVLLPEDRPVNAFDGDLRTAWLVDTGTPLGVDPRIGITLERPSSADHLTLVGPQGRPGSRAVVHAEVVLDGTRTFDVNMTEEQARAPEGVVVPLDGKPFSSVEVRILGVAPDPGPAGFSEITIPGVQVEEMIQLPQQLLDRLGKHDPSAPLALVLTRQRADAAEVVRQDPELAMRRTFTLDAPLEVGVTGTARLHAGAPDALIDAAVGLPGATAGGWTATSTEQLAGSLAARASSAFDGDPTTSWSTPLVGITGQALELDAGRPVRLDELDVTVVADEHHSTPRRLNVSVDGGAPVPVDLPAAQPGALGATAHFQVALPTPLVGQHLKIEVADAEPRLVTDSSSGTQVALPVAITEVGVPGLPTRTPASTVDATCRTDLLTVDGAPVGVRLTGSSTDALAGKGLEVIACDGTPLVLGPGSHDVRTSPGADTGIDLDRLVLTTPEWATTPVQTAAGPTVKTDTHTPTKAAGSLHTDGKPFWVQLDQSMNDGWQLRVDDADVKGPITLDGSTAGWLVTPDHPGTLAYTVTWTPQRAVDIALIVSALGVLLCLVLIALSVRAARRSKAPPAGPPVPDAPLWDVTGPPTVRPASVLAAVVVGLATAAAAALVIHPLAALAAGPLGAVAVLWPRLGRFLPASLVAAAAGQMMWIQAREHHELSRDWPHWFSGAHIAAFLGVLVLGAGAAWESWSARAHPTTPDRATSDPGTRDVAEGRR